MTQEAQKYHFPVTRGERFRLIQCTGKILSGSATEFVSWNGFVL